MFGLYGPTPGDFKWDWYGAQMVQAVLLIGVPARVFNISFTGESGYELHVDADDAAGVAEAVFARELIVWLRAHEFQRECYSVAWSPLSEVVAVASNTIDRDELEESTSGRLA